MSRYSSVPPLQWPPARAVGHVVDQAWILNTCPQQSAASALRLRVNAGCVELVLDSSKELTCRAAPSSCRSAASCSIFMIVKDPDHELGNVFS